MDPMRRFPFLNTLALATILDMPASSAPAHNIEATEIPRRAQE